MEKQIDEFGVSKILVKDLWFELTERGLKYTGNKPILVERILL